MKTLTLTRFNSTDQGTLGALTSADGRLKLYTIELPWRDNRPQRSCIPVSPRGKYICVPVRSPKFGDVYAVNDVVGRSLIRIHAANFAGDIERGYKTELLGCIAPCLRFGEVGGQIAGLDSKIALARLKAFLDYQAFVLRIV